MSKGIGLGRTGLGGIVALLAIVGCSGESPSTEGSSTDLTEVAAPERETPPPPPPLSPLPADLHLDAGADAPPPPGDPSLRTMWAVDGTDHLVHFTNAAPGTVKSLAITGLAAGEHVLGIDFRPADGLLYALGTTSRLYVIDRVSGAAKAVGAKAFTPALAGAAFGFDVNPVADRMRVQSDTDQNLRIDPMTGLATSDPALAFATGDPNQGQSPNLVATAYTNSVNPAPATTELYAIDSTRNLLTKLANPNDGKVTTVGALGVDVADVAGFDIWGGASSTGAARPLEAYAVLMAGGKTSLFTIDLAKGTAKAVGVIGHPVAVHGLAIEP